MDLENKINSINENNEFLNQFKKNEAFSVPENYFEELPKIIMNQCTTKQNRGFFVIIPRVVKYSFTALLVLIFTSTLYYVYYYLNTNQISNSSQFTENELNFIEMEEFELLYLDEGDFADTIDYNTNIYSIEQSISENTITDSINLNNNNQVIKLEDISTEEILNYLEQENSDDDFL